MENKTSAPVLKGIIIALALIVFGLIIYYTGQTENKTLGYMQYIILLIGIVWSCITYARQMNGNVTFGNVFAHGFKTNAVVTVFIILYSVLALKFLFPDIVQKSIEASRQKLEETGKFSDNQIDQQLTMMKDHFLLFAVAGVLIVFAIVGAISALIGAAIAKKNPQGPFTNQQV